MWLKADYSITLPNIRLQDGSIYFDVADENGGTVEQEQPYAQNYKKHSDFLGSVKIPKEPAESEEKNHAQNDRDKLFCVFFEAYKRK